MTTIKNKIIVKKFQKQQNDMQHYHIYVKIHNNICTYRIFRNPIPHVVYNKKINITIKNQRYIHMYRCDELPANVINPNVRLIANFPANIPEEDIDDTLTDIFKNMSI